MNITKICVLTEQRTTARNEGPEFWCDHACFEHRVTICHEKHADKDLFEKSYSFIVIPNEQDDEEVLDHDDQTLAVDCKWDTLSDSLSGSLHKDHSFNISTDWCKSFHGCICNDFKYLWDLENTRTGNNREADALRNGDLDAFLIAEVLFVDKLIPAVLSEDEGLDHLELFHLLKI